MIVRLVTRSLASRNIQFQNGMFTVGTTVLKYLTALIFLIAINSSMHLLTC